MTSPARAPLPVLVAALAAIACGPTSRGGGDGGVGDDDDGLVDAPGYPGGTVTGTVWAPGNAPGLVATGHEIPVSGALVYVADTPPAPIPDGVYCDPCAAPPFPYVTTDARGVFVLPNVAPGRRRLVIEKAQFRREVMIDVPADAPVAVSAEVTTLPSRHAPAEGLWIPRVAIAIGDSDHLADIFAKMGILALGPTHEALEASFDDTDQIDLWGNPIDPPYPSRHQGSITDLFGDLDTLRRYHVVFVPCNFESDVAALTPQVRQNIRDYVAEGGKLYVTDWSAEWMDAAFPGFVAFDPSHDTTPEMAASGTINPGDGDFGHFAASARATDPELAAWLDGQRAPLVIPQGDEAAGFPSTYVDGEIDADDFVIEGNWNLIRSLPEVTIGTDEAGDPIVETATTWISGDFQGTYYPHTVTFEPSCGRVLYSTYHTAQKPHPGLVPQERVLLHLIMEIGVCNDGPIVD